MKFCTGCNCSKPLDAFSKCKSAKDGLQFRCKACKKAYKAANRELVNAGAARARERDPEKHREAVRAYRLRNPGKDSATKAAWYKANAERLREKAKTRTANDPTYFARYRMENSERERARKAAWEKANPHKVAAFVAARRAAKKLAIPCWQDPARLTSIYRKAQRLTAELGKPHHVDHIVPLQSKIVCGLHCEANLRVIEGVENVRKGNRHWPDMP